MDARLDGFSGSSDDRQDRADLDDFLFFDREPENGSGIWGGHFDDGFVGFDLGERLVDLNFFALRNKPTDQFAFAQPFADIGKPE
jgi:hypothetical protein